MTQTIEIPEGFELKKVSDTEYKIVEKEKHLPKTWEEFCKLHPIQIGECLIENRSNIIRANCRKRDSYIDQNVLPSKEKAEAVLALCQLIQLRDYYNDGWKPNWKENSWDKSVIFLHGGEFKPSLNSVTGRVLVFKTEKLRDEFFNNFKDLIEKLRPLYE